MNRLVRYAFIATSFLTLNSCMKKQPSVTISGKLYSKNGVAMKNTEITIIPNAEQLDQYQKKTVVKTLSDGSFNYVAEFRGKDTRVSIDCVSDSGRFSRTNLSQKDAQALSHEFILE